MDTWIAMAKGPLFRISLAVCLLGLAYHFVVTFVQVILMKKRAADRNLPLGPVVKASLSWLWPAQLMRVRPLFGIASAVFHLGILAIPLFYVGHVALWQRSLPLGWPRLGPAVCDVLAIMAILGLGVLLASRLILAANRDLTSAQDIFLLVLLTVLLATGYWAAHPASSPIPPRTMVLLHMLAGNLALILTPLTKIAHCILYPFAQLISELGWRFPAESGRHVGMALGKDEDLI
jgi:nitrate reductase gamma subunit